MQFPLRPFSRTVIRWHHLDMSQPHSSPTLRGPPDAGPAECTVALFCSRRLVGDMLKSWLNRAGFRVIGRVDDLAALGRVCAVHHPDLVIMDAGTDLTEVRESSALLRSGGPRTHLVVFYDWLSPADLAAARRSGLGTLIPSSTGLESFFLQLHRGPGTATNLAARVVDQALTDQERQTLNLVSAGYSVRRIADLLNISLSAVEGAKRRIYAKLRVATQSQAVARAVALGLVDPLESPETPATDRHHPPDLTAREFDVLRSIARGDTVRQTARLLTIAEKTVESLKGRLFLKLGAHNTAGAIRTAHALGLLDGEADDPVRP